ncbi:MAG: hypothetical protein H6Q90_5173 [Deltaproteobacteria bacterium]|nr:hypothetical protein [Deltaproteobacteria bacterium]
MKTYVAVLLVVGASCSGCVVGNDPPSDVDDVDDVDATTLDVVDAYRGLSQINSHAYVSDLGPFDINCYVAGDVAKYQQIHPEQSGSGIRVAVGTVIVREVLDAQGAVEKLTVMAKGPPGFDPSLGDWWFGVTDPQGRPLEDDAGALLGRLTQCHGCHDARAQDDYLFGVPSIDI